MYIYRVVLHYSHNSKPMKLSKAQQKLLDKSLQARNIEAIQKLAERDANEIWSRNWIDGGLPAYERPKKEKWSGGLWNFISGTIKELRP